jgi:hypothetical protein
VADSDLDADARFGEPALCPCGESHQRADQAAARRGGAEDAYQAIELLLVHGRILSM